MRTSNRGKVLLISIAAPLLFVVAFALVVAAYSYFHKSPEVDMVASGFAPQNIVIQEGTTIHFVNRSATTAQILCLGSNQHCDRTILLGPIQSPPPRDLLGSGVRIAPGESKDIVFDTAGTFSITSAAAPGMNLTVTVNAND